MSLVKREWFKELNNEEFKEIEAKMLDPYSEWVIVDNPKEKKSYKNKMI
ncbi:MAG: hypothetical protein LBM96_09450 [Methanobrevibacter sp.]|nr:hypothetical protein [Candidatus Methanoflexus mossambicus]